MATSKIPKNIKIKDFENVETDSNGFIQTNLQNILVLGCTRRSGAINSTTQMQITTSYADAPTPNAIGVRFTTWNGSTAITGNISFRLYYIEV